MPDPIVIVDARGTEHEFPAGFDPVKAAGIVRSNAGGTESGTYAGGFFNSLAKTAKDSATNIVSGAASTVDPRAWWAAMQAKSKADNPDAAGVADRTARQSFSLSNIPANVSGRAQQAKDELTSLTTPEGGGQAIGNLAAMLALGRAPQAAGAVPVRAPVVAALDVASEVAQHPMLKIGQLAGKGLGTLADTLRPHGPTVKGFDRYGGQSGSSYKPGDVTPPSPSEATIFKTPSGGVVGRDATTGQFTKADPKWEGAPAKPGTVGDMLADPREQSVLTYNGPERRVSGPEARQAWDDQTHARMLQQLGGRGKPPTAAELELAQRLGQPGDAEMQMAISARNAGTRWQPTAPSSSVRVPVSLNDAMAAAVRKVKK